MKYQFIWLGWLGGSALVRGSGLGLRGVDGIVSYYVSRSCELINIAEEGHNM